jgi:hypothetical protein
MNRKPSAEDPDDLLRRALQALESEAQASPAIRLLQSELRDVRIRLWAERSGGSTGGDTSRSSTEKA